MDPRIGVFICKCGTNIAEVVDTDQLAAHCRAHPAVAHTAVVELACAEDGREAIRAALAATGVTHVVVAACSPKVHELTFQKVMREAGRNPYLLQMVNLREQIAWVTEDRAAATGKAIHHVNAAIARVAVQEPLEPRSIDACPDILVIGAGAAGLTAALTAAQKVRRVYLVEREPWIGGHVTSYEDVFPNLECAPCMLEPQLDHVLHHERIETLTYSEVENVKGYFGHFTVAVRRRARRVDPAKCFGCAACYEACPVKVKNRFDGGLSERHAVYTGYAGMLPNVPVVDPEHCLRLKGQACNACAEACAFGAFDFDQVDELRELEVGAIIIATGFKLRDVAKGLPDVIDNAQFERILSSSGPTGGRLLTSKGVEPAAIAFVHCAGSRSAAHRDYCSAICCTDIAKMAHLAHEKSERHPKITQIFRDECLPGKGAQRFRDKYTPAGTERIRVADPNALKFSADGGRIRIDHGAGSLVVDMAILAAAIEPSEGTARMAGLVGATLDRHGFIQAGHDVIAPAATNIRGVYVAGCAEGPRDIAATVAHAQAAAGLALQSLIPGERIELEVMTAEVDPDRCSGCHVCPSLCPYQAIRFNPEKKVAEVNDALCHGCGVCVAGCPAGAIANHGFTYDQISAEIKGVLA